MSNDVQSHEDVAERAAGDDRRAGERHAARSLGSVTARIIGGSSVDLVNFSTRGVLFECDSRLLIGARASVRITTADTNLVVTGRVVRSRVKGLVDGALRYDAALVLDAELNLTPAIVEAVRAEAGSPAGEADFVADDLVNFESDVDPAADPSPVEAYLAESEASLLEAHVSESPLHFPGAVEATPVEAEAAPVVAAEPPPLPGANAAAAEPAADESIAFEPDGDIAFEPAVEFAFDQMGEPVFETVVQGDVDAAESAATVAAIERATAERSAGTSMFDATYIPPADDFSGPGESQFVVTPPRPVLGEGTSSFFDARPSHAYGDAAVEPVAETPTVAPLIDVHVAIHADLVSTPGADVAAGEASEPVDVDTEVAFEAEAVMFEAAFDEVAADSGSGPAASEPPASEPFALALVDAPVTPDTLDAAPTPAAPDVDVIDPPASVAITDRVLLQFAATVPHDLAELQRIAADNQW
jgi:hypothetical protein